MERARGTCGRARGTGAAPAPLRAPVPVRREVTGIPARCGKVVGSPGPGGSRCGRAGGCGAVPLPHRCATGAWSQRIPPGGVAAQLRSERVHTGAGKTGARRSAGTRAPPRGAEAAPPHRQPWGASGGPGAGGVAPSSPGAGVYPPRWHHHAPVSPTPRGSRGDEKRKREAVLGLPTPGVSPPLSGIPRTPGSASHSRVPPALRAPGPRGLRRRRDVSPPAPPHGPPRASCQRHRARPAMAGLLQALVGASEKAGTIARLCRAEEPLFQLLVAEKSGTDKNRRFLRDFKTLADVLIQEVIKHDLGKEFPELQGHIHGEESNEFRNRQGDTVVVRVCDTPGDTAALLLSVLEPEREAAELLAAAVHQDVTLGDAELASVELSIPPQDLAIWIDPIDSTNEYIGGHEDVAPIDGITPAGLCSALVLIGAYDRQTGCPVLGIINEPFYRRDPLTHRWQGRYHWGVAYGDTQLSSLNPPPPRPTPCVVLSRAEGGPVRAALGPLCGDRLCFAAGAGYKMLCVILGLADAYVLSEGSTFTWDACAPHAILRALGGGAVALAGALQARRAGDTSPPPELVYNRPVQGAVGAKRWANQGGLVAYMHPQHLEAVLAALATVPGL